MRHLIVLLLFLTLLPGCGDKNAAYDMTGGAVRDGTYGRSAAKNDPFEQIEKSDVPFPDDPALLYSPPESYAALVDDSDSTTTAVKSTETVAQGASDAAADGEADGSTDGETAGSVDAPASALAEKSRRGRKIQYTAQVDLVVEDFDKLQRDVEALVKKFDAYLAGSSVSGAAGNRRSGQWRIRVPVGRFDQFLDEARGLGELQSLSTDSQDVTEQYYDVETRLANKRKELERFNKLADRFAENLEGERSEIIAVQREISRVESEIESLTGRLRLLRDLTSLTTVTISAQEIQDYQPPEAPTFGSRVGRTFARSLESVGTLGQEVVLFLILALPYLVLLAILLLLIRAWWRRRRI